MIPRFVLKINPVRNFKDNFYDNDLLEIVYQIKIKKRLLKISNGVNSRGIKNRPPNRRAI